MSTASSNTNPFVELLGPTLIRDANGKQTVKTVDALKGKDLVLLYFSASWCSPCQTFSPILKEFYKKTNNSKHNVEIIYVSSDSSVAEFEGYFGTMPWLSLPVEETATIKNKLAQTMKIRGIPALIVLDKQALYISDQARNDVTAYTKESNKEAALVNLIASWKAIKPVPLDQAPFEGSTAPGAGGFMGILMTLLKNPAAIFALMYFVKWAMRKYKQLTLPDDDDGSDDAAADAAAAAAMLQGQAAAPNDDGQTEF
mmetsp:Transcript_2047/g.2859  ORF Transcript_2047/g.2859 Transcript_2047/m.2859 type:complete len:256 (+) Transcript_2047:101-868(+)